MLETAISDEISSAIQRARTQDEDQGEIHVHVSKRRLRVEPANPFAICFGGSLGEIMDKAKLTRAAIRLLLQLLSAASYGNLVSVNQKGIAKQLRTTPSAVSRSMRELIRAGVILEVETGLFFNPQLISRQGLDMIAKSYPAEVLEGIEVLRRYGMEPNWVPGGKRN